MLQETKQELLADKLRARRSTQAIVNILGINRMLVFRVKKMLDVSGTVKTIYGGGRRQAIRTFPVVRAVENKIFHNPRRFIRKLALDHNISEKSMRRLVKNDLGMKSRAVVIKN